MKEQKLFGSF